MSKTIKACDLFAGAGGTSTGLLQACAALGHTVELTAINHWPIAVATHSTNHPAARHLCASVDDVNPRSLYREGELDVLWASPECCHHSRARGGRPVNEQSRATAHCVTRWAEALRPPVILVENVEELLSWGGLDAKGNPLKAQRGKTFMAWVAMLESLGYRVDWRILCAADYDSPTTRRQLFIQAVRGRLKIVWPEPTHAPPRRPGSAGRPPETLATGPRHHRLVDSGHEYFRPKEAAQAEHAGQHLRGPSEVRAQGFPGPAVAQRFRCLPHDQRG
jgi:DNA (cytosine-5)-methyltransferase 1